MQLIAEFIGEKIGSAAVVSSFSLVRQREFMRWSADKYQHSAGTISRNLSVANAAFRFSCKPQIVRDGFKNEIEVTLLDSAPDVVTQPKEVARLTALPESTPRDWLPSFEQFGAFIDKIDVRQENLFRFVMMALNTWARPEAVIDLRKDHADRLALWCCRSEPTGPPSNQEVSAKDKADRKPCRLAPPLGLRRADDLEREARHDNEADLQAPCRGVRLAALHPGHHPPFHGDVCTTGQTAGLERAA